jgi:hypothetical protein
MKTKEEARKILKEWLPPHSEVYYLVQFNKSGAYVRLFYVSKNQIDEITMLAATAIEATYVEDKGIHRRGTGYGYGSDTVKELEYVIGNTLIYRKL